MKKNNKITLTVSSLIIALGLSGCSFDLIKTERSKVAEMAGLLD